MKTSISLDELRYYRNLLTLEVGDMIEWRISKWSPSGLRMKGKIKAIYPEGKGRYIGKQYAFMTVHAHTPSGFHYSVSLTNPTIRKMETDK